MDARDFARRDEPVGDRLAGVALLDADGEAGEVVDGSDVRQPSGVDGQRLYGDQIWRDDFANWTGRDEEPLPCALQRRSLSPLRHRL